MKKERFIEILSKPMSEVMNDPTISDEEFSFCMENCEKNIDEIDFDE